MKAVLLILTAVTVFAVRECLRGGSIRTIARPVNWEHERRSHELKMRQLAALERLGSAALIPLHGRKSFFVYKP